VILNGSGRGGYVANEPDLRQGATDEETGGYVTYLQQLLADYYTGQVDGIFGPITDAAVRQYQQDKGLTVDGWVGPITWGVLTGESGGGEGGEEGDQAVQVDWSQLGYLSALVSSSPSDTEGLKVALGVDPQEDEGEAMA
jgi:peptidoglycan hydrolase-like protein with peptidoglycan-binding domain